ncbi:MAG: GIY-YIG nuclease family protein [Pseudomonadota bacterium]
MYQSIATFILASKPYGALYVDYAEDLSGSVLDHKCNIVGGVTSLYAIHTLVYYEYHLDIKDAMSRKWEIEALHRIWKLDLIDRQNPEWRDLYPDINPVQDSILNTQDSLLFQD